MTQDQIDAPERPLLPPKAEKEHGLLRAIVTAVAVLVLLVGAWRAYEWLASDVARRRAVAENGAAPASAPAGATAPQPLPAPTGRTIGPPQPGATATDPAPPAVAGGVNKCVVDGQVTYTNQPCPEGGASAPPTAAGTDANGVTGSTGEAVPRGLARPAVLSSGDDPSQHEADCRFLAAEIARLDYELRQPLPPPVLDGISTQLAGLRAQNRAAKCAPTPKATDAAPAPKRAAPAAANRPDTTNRP